MTKSEVSIPSGSVKLGGVLELPATPRGIVVFSHGSGSGRHSPRNQFVAKALRDHGIGTLLLDLLRGEEDQEYERHFDIDLLTERLSSAVDFVRNHASTRNLSIGLFGASAGAACALRVAVAMPAAVRAVVSRGGRPDLTGDDLLTKVKSPTLLIVGSCDYEVLALEERARDALLHCDRQLKIVRGATHLFEEPGALEEVARLASKWFVKHLSPRQRRGHPAKDGVEPDGTLAPSTHCAFRADGGERETAH
jgi:dienelactone hydrolase